MNKNVIIGVLPQVTTKNDNIFYNDRNEFVDMYSKKIKECDADVIGLLINDNKIDKSVLDLCDGFLIPGGVNINSAYFDVINYAISHNKPLLGICLGMQVLGIYSMFVDDSNHYNKNEFTEKYNKYKEEHSGLVLNKIESTTIVHNTYINNDTVKESFHPVHIIDKESYLYDAYKQDVIDEASLHQYTPSYIGDEFKITAKAKDGIVEAIEYKDSSYFIVGVQFHPENDETNVIFKKLVEGAAKRKINKDSKYLILVNSTNPMKDDNLFIKVDADSKYDVNRSLEEKTYEAFKKLREYAKENGYIIDLESGYRSKELQQEVWDDCLKDNGLEHTKKYVAVPGYSEHQTGLAADVTLFENGKWYIDTQIKNNDYIKFLHDNCYKFGFILRYPKGKENITGYNYEPWHIRYIDNVNIAKYIKDNNLCLEEYLNQ